MFTVYGPGGSPNVLEEILEGQMDPKFSPLQSLKNFSAKFDVCAATCGKPFEAEGLTITAREHAHGATTALAFRIVEDGRTFIYSSDVGQPFPDTPPTSDTIAFLRGADVLLHDTTYRPEDQASRRNRAPARATPPPPASPPTNHDTIALLVLAANGDIAGGCSTSGWAGKLPGPPRRTYACAPATVASTFFAITWKRQRPSFN